MTKSATSCFSTCLFISLVQIFANFCSSSGVDDSDARNLVYSKDLKSHFRYYELITPEVYHDNRRLKSTLQQNGGHYKDLTVIIRAFDREFVLDLRLNANLFGNTYVEKRVHENHHKFTEHFPNHTEQHCYFHGVLRSSSSSSPSSSSSSAAFSTCDGLRGQLTVKNDVFYVEPVADTLPSLSSVHYIVGNSDFLLRNRSCGHDANPRSLGTDQDAQINRMKRSVESRVRLREPTDADVATRYVELYIVNDFSQYYAFNRSTNRVNQRTKDIINIVSSIYRPLNIYVILVGIEVWTNRNLIEVNGNSENTLNQFLEYRRRHINPFHRNDNAQLIIGRELGDGIVGKAPVMSICTHKLSGGVNADRSPAVGAVATTVAHEMGHNFGLPHDNTDKFPSCECEESHCVMSSGGSPKIPTKWSSCSKQVLSDSFHQGMDYCLQNIPETTSSSVGAVCGNGFMEDGEECDCGLEQDCKSKCCIASTCRLAPNATCASGKCCNSATCQLSEPATVCRKSSGFCDLPEFCDGLSEHCPSDVFREDGSECEDRMVSSYCYHGSCKTHDSQCRMLWGRSGKMSNSLCFDHFNIMGTGHGHCGFSWLNESFQKCEPKDVLCGMLHCEHRSEKLMFWKEALMFTMPDSYVIMSGRRFDCKAAIMDVGLDMPDPGMTFDGTKCGEKQMCQSHRCRAIETLNFPTCPGCNGHGICNSLGQCHCDLDYDPPFCQSAGRGGSTHSGPAQKYPPSNKSLALGLCLFFLVVLPFCIAIIVLFYRNYECVKFFTLEFCQRCQTNNLLKRRKEQQIGKEAVDLSPREVVVENGVDTVAVAKTTNIRRAVSFRPEDISSPLLQSSTNSSLDVAQSDKGQVALAHASSCRAPNNTDIVRPFVKANPKLTNMSGNNSTVVSNRSIESHASNASCAPDSQSLLQRHYDEVSTHPLRPAPLRPAPPPPYACPKKPTTENTKLPTNPKNLSTESSKRTNVTDLSPRNSPFIVVSAAKTVTGNGDVSLPKVPEKKTFDKPSSKEEPRPSTDSQTSSVLRLKSTFEGNDTSSTPASVDRRSSSFQSNRQRNPLPVGKVSNPSPTVAPPKPAPPKRPPLSRPETFSAGSSVKPASSGLRHHASEAGGATNKGPSLAPKPLR